MKFERAVSLKKHNTFGVEVLADRYVSVSSNAQLKKIVASEKNIFILGGGSNLLFTKNIKTLVLHLNTKGKKVEPLNETTVRVTAQAGENWHEFVLWCLKKNYGGLENLSLIPGNVGTAPIQNIGAYGVEVKELISEVEALEIETGAIRIFKNSDCQFAYRDSIFKNQLKNKYILLSVSFELRTKNHTINSAYGAIGEELALKNIKHPTPKNISDAVVSIREKKLPDPNLIGNAGSFFKNPIIDKPHVKRLQKIYEAFPFYSVSETQYKIPAAWLIEKCGFKGKQFGTVGVHEKQALVLVNYGNGTGREILALAKQIQIAVEKKFSISLEIEVNVI